ncbi:ABC transporter ATP-binding protein [Gordonia sp. TBRC 11910]|uniref:ABC transporter ATP-binding protein n=1 Tax=Gordonia asplenii TaxID=2725283 RepID=A0A848KWR3_9ACTN|nr:ABC transporter ATP-binding protein [Gordonia asplenii]NMO00903.1 ABC transporter ATP-binding protein [Gordonia asplenii]
MNSVVLQMHEVTLTYPDGDGRLTALDAVDLTVRRGELTAITGPSGSGKSSLLAVASGLIRPDSGKVLLHRQGGVLDLCELSRAELTALRRTDVGIVFQQPNLVSGLTAVEQLEVTERLGQHRWIGPRRRREIRRRALDLLDAVGVADRATARPDRLSGGQRQRVNIARALMGRPGLLVVDEPTSALDTERGAAVMALLARLTAERDAATLLVTHDRLHASTADHRAEVVDGRLTCRPGVVRLDGQCDESHFVDQSGSRDGGETAAADVAAGVRQSR